MGHDHSLRVGYRNEQDVRLSGCLLEEMLQSDAFSESSPHAGSGSRLKGLDQGGTFFAQYAGNGPVLAGDVHEGEYRDDRGQDDRSGRDGPPGENFFWRPGG
jgi:hypothetical protein